MADPSSHPQRSHSSSSQKDLLPIEVAIGLTTVPFLAALVGTKMLASAVQELGRWSEELFRGDRLPSLDLPSPPPSNTTGNP
ncbi:MAG: hypothetical protein NW220_23005 [Leptolyngbyaceae cyanobacterium bins.349]|nr:hypothetical protein [Leptolyngbyaceae cyanobacterium bins.349]